MTAREKKSKAKEKVEQDTRGSSSVSMLGFVFWWTIRQVELAQDAMYQFIDKAFGANFRPDVPSMRRAIRDTLETMHKNGVITRIPSGDDDKVAYTLHRKEVDQQNIDLDLEKEQTIIYYKSTKKVEIKAEYKRAEISALIAKYSSVFTEEDVRAVVLRYLKASGAVTMRESGGIYFGSQDQRDRLCDYIESCGGNFWALGVPDTDQDKAVMHEIVKTEIENDLQLAAEELKTFMAGGDKKQIGALENRVERFKEIKAKAQMYRDLLSSDVGELSQQIDRVAREASDALSGQIKAYPQSEKFPLHSRVEYTGRSKEKYGDRGTVVGYWTDSEKYNFGQYIRVYFDQSDKIIVIGVNGLKLEGASTSSKKNNKKTATKAAA